MGQKFDVVLGKHQRLVLTQSLDSLLFWMATPKSSVKTSFPGSMVVIDCEAVMYSDFDEAFWLSGDSFVKKNSSLPVFYNYTR